MEQHIVYYVHMTNNGVTVNIGRLHYSYAIDLLLRYKFYFFRNTCMYRERLYEEIDTYAHNTSKYNN